ncbi:MAG: uracil-DNA glycosylase [Planctomycetota bacterium]|nr:MAG: uracil-DNA glycosylase [Planctomycetota bacterium]
MEVADGIAFAPRSTVTKELQRSESIASPVAPSSSPQASSAASLPAPIFAPADTPAVQRLERVAELVAACQRCGLCAAGRQHTVPGEGAADARLLFVGEGPGFEEDRSGRPFVGPAGQLLDRMIQAMGLSRDQVFIANVVKCRPPDNRTPEAEEVAACLPYLQEQVAAIAPEVICTLGHTPLRALRDDQRIGITRARGSTFTWRGVTVVPTFHPSYLLRNESAKRLAWADLKQVMQLLGSSPPSRS